MLKINLKKNKNIYIILIFFQTKIHFEKTQTNISKAIFQMPVLLASRTTPSN